MKPLVLRMWGQGVLPPVYLSFVRGLSHTLGISLTKQYILLLANFSDIVTHADWPPMPA